MRSNSILVAAKAVWVLLLIGLFGSFTPMNETKQVIIEGKTQGTTYRVVYFHSKETVTKNQIEKKLNELDSSLSLYHPNSLINQFNASKAGIVVDYHLKKVVEKALAVYKETKGVFDITIHALTSLYGFVPAEKKAEVNDRTVKDALSCVGSGYLYWKGVHYLAKKKPCVKLDVNGIAQGYSVDVIAQFLEFNNIRNYMVEIGGEVRVNGRHLFHEDAFYVGIEKPSLSPFSSQLFAKLKMGTGAITTSGSYRKYYESGGKIKSHLIDAKTGQSIDNEMISATVFAKTTMEADAYDNVLMSWGIEKTAQFLQTKKDMGALLIYKNTNGEIRDTLLGKFPALTYF